MSQPLLDVPQTDTVGVKKAGTAMAEIVETDFFQSVVFQYNLKMLCDEVWFDKFAHCIYIPFSEAPKPHGIERLPDGEIRYFLGPGYDAPLHHGERYADGRIPTEPSGGNKSLKLKQQRDGIVIPLLLFYRKGVQRRKGERP